MAHMRVFAVTYITELILWSPLIFKFFCTIFRGLEYYAVEEFWECYVVWLVLWMKLGIRAWLMPSEGKIAFSDCMNIC